MVGNEKPAWDTVGVGDLYSACAVWVSAATTVSSQGVAGVSLGFSNPPANVEVPFATAVPVKEAVALGKPAAEVAVAAGFVLDGPPGLEVFVAVAVCVGVWVLVAVLVDVDEDAGLLVLVAVAVAVCVLTDVLVGVRVGDAVEVEVLEGVDVEVAEGLAVNVTVGEGVNVLEGVWLGTCVGMAVAFLVLVGFLVGLA